MASSSLIVPLAFWVNLPTAPITTVAYKEGHIVTGLEDGHIWIYRCIINEQGAPQLQHKILCLGHKSSITALTIIEGQTDGCAGNDYVLISSSKDGDVNKWCLLDGRCLTSISKAFCGIIKSLKPLAEYSQPAKFLLCSGFSNEITILNCTTLELVRIWGGHNDWVACTPFYDSDARQIRLLTSNFNGILKIWAFDESNHINKEYDNVGLLEAQGDKILELISNPYDIGVILAITRSYAITFTIRRGKMVNFQRIRTSKEGIYWASGAFLSKNRMLLWNQMGNAYLYSIPSYMEKKIATENAHLHIKPELIRRSSLPNLQKSNVEKMPNSAQLRPQLLETVCSDNESLAITTVFALSSIDGKASNLYLITFRNQINGTSFAFKTLSPMAQESGICENNYNVRELKWPSETYLSDIWQLNHKNDNITVTTMVYDVYLATGYENGEIHLVPLSMALTQSAEIQNSTSITNSIHKLEGHIGKVTCLYTPNSQNLGHDYLLSGGEDCSVRIWNLEGKQLASFKYHSQSVTHFFEPPSDECQRLKRCVISVAKDNSLAIISLEGLNCLYVFGGYPYPLNKIQWRNSEGFIILFYNDDTAHMWQTETLELYQKVTGSAVRDMLKDASWRTSSVEQQEFVINKTLTSVTDNSDDGKTFLQIFTINIKQLINDIYHYHVSQFGSKPNCTRTIEDFDEKPSTVSKIFSWTTGGALQSSSVTSTSPSIEPETKAIDASTVQVLISTLMTWGIDSSLDKLCAEKLGLKKSSNRITFGLRGANGNMAFAVPSPNDSAAIWKISQTMTASLLLSIVGLTRSFLSMKGLEKYTSELITHYGSLLPELVGKEYCHSSLAFHAKYFQDPLEDIRISARTLFSSALNNMPSSELTSIIDYWKQFLPAVASPGIYNNQYMARSTILLGMIGADYPNYLSQTVARNIALSLVLLLHDSSKLSHRLAALELCGKGFSTWEPHFDAVAVLKTLFTFAIETDTNAATIRAMAQKAIFQISAVNTPLCISTLTHDTNDSKKPTEKSGFLKLVSIFIRKRPILLHSNLSGLVEAVVKSLDPNIPKMRDTVLQTTTSVLHDLVKTFPSVTFHGGLQKLAVGTLEGASIIYDLRTATRLHILEGHTKSVTAITFSGDGRLIVSCSLEEGTVRVWNPNPGFLGMIAGSLTNGNGGNGNGTSRKTPLLSSIRTSKTFAFNLGEDARLSVASILESVYFEWVADRTVKLHVKDSIMSFNV